MAAPYGPAVRDVLLEALFASGSDLLLLPVQDVFGWRDRINEPATVNDQQLDVPAAVAVDRLDEVPEARERQARLRAWSAEARPRYNFDAMATLRPFRALRPTPTDAAAIAAVPYDVVNTDEARALADGNPAQLSARVARGDRAAARHRSLRRRGLRSRRREFRRAAERRRSSSKTSRACISTGCAMGDHEQTGRGRLLFARRVRSRRHQEARADAARQGRRSHAAHDRARRADRAGVPDVSRARPTSTRSRSA